MIVRLAGSIGALVHHGEDGFGVLVADRIDVQEGSDALKAERHEHEQHGGRRQQQRERDDDEDAAGGLPEHGC